MPRRIPAAALVLLLLAVALVPGPGLARERGSRRQETGEEDKACIREKLAALPREYRDEGKKAASVLCRAEAQGITPYQGPLFDAISQIAARVGVDSALERVKAAGVDKLALFARLEHDDKSNEKAVLRAIRHNPDLIVPGAPKRFDLRGDLAAAYVDHTLEGIEEHGYRFVGEILYTHADKDPGEITGLGERYVDPLGPETARLLAALSGSGVPVMTHWEAYAWERDAPRFHKLYAENPDVLFIIPHMAFASPAQVREFLSRHKNVYMTTSKKQKPAQALRDKQWQAALGGPMLDENMRLDPEWREVLVEFQDQILLGTDPHIKKLWDRYGGTMAHHRVLLGQLPPDVAKKIAWTNAARLYRTE